MNYPEIYLLIDLDNYNKYITFKDKKRFFSFNKTIIYTQLSNISLANFFLVLESEFTPSYVK